MLYKVYNGSMEEYPDDAIKAAEGSTLEAQGFFSTKAEAKAFKLLEISTQIRNQEVILSNLQRHLDTTGKLEE